MVSSPIIRILLLAALHRYRILMIAIGVTIVTCISAHFTPYTYRSEAIIQITDHNQRRSTINTYLSSQMAETNKSLYQALTIIRSLDFATAVAKEIQTQAINLHEAFPKTISWFDIRKRLAILKSHLGIQNRTRDNKRIAVPLELTIFALQQELSSEINRNSQSIHLAFQSMTPQAAQQILSIVVKELETRINADARKEIQKEQEFLRLAINEQVKLITTLERKIQEILKSRPELIGRSSEQGAMSFLSQEFVTRMSRLRSIQNEIELNKKVISDISNKIGISANNEHRLSPAVATELLNRLNEIEARRIEYEQVIGYESSNSNLVALKDKADRLRSILTNTNNTGKPSRAPASLASPTLIEKISQLKEENYKLGIESDYIKSKISNKNKQMDEWIGIDFDLAGLNRNIKSGEDVLTNMHNRLQETNINFVTHEAPARTILAASFPLYTTTLSIRKKTVFAFFVGLAIALIIIFTIDLASPVFLLPSDFDAVKITGIGTFNAHNSTDLSKIAAHILNAVQTSTKTNETQLKTVVFAAAGAEGALHLSFIEQLAAGFRQRGQSITVLVVDSRPRPDNSPPRTQSKPAGLQIIHPEDVPYTYKDRLQTYQRNSDWVFVLDRQYARDPRSILVGQLANHICFVAHLGTSKIAALRAVHRLHPEVTIQHGVILKGRPKSGKNQITSWIKRISMKTRQNTDHES